MKLVSCRSKADIRNKTLAFLYKAFNYQYPEAVVLKVTRKDNSLGLYFAVHARYFVRNEYGWVNKNSMSFYGTFPTIYVALKKVKQLVKDNADFELKEDFVQEFLKHRRGRK
jgi:hypothetical protein